MVFSLKGSSNHLNSDTTDTITPIIEPICDEEYIRQQKQTEFFWEEIMKAFNIESPDSLNHK